MSAGWQKLFNENPKIGFLAHAKIFKEAHAAGKILAPATTGAQMKQVLINDYVDSALCAIFMLVVIIVFFSAIRIWYKVLSNQKLPLHEAPYVPRNEGDYKKYA
jgi:carbon starvation protein